MVARAGESCRTRRSDAALTELPTRRELHAADRAALPHARLSSALRPLPVSSPSLLGLTVYLYSPRVVYILHSRLRLVWRLCCGVQQLKRHWWRLAGRRTEHSLWLHWSARRWPCCRGAVHVVAWARLEGPGLSPRHRSAYRPCWSRGRRSGATAPPSIARRRAPTPATSTCRRRRRIERLLLCRGERRTCGLRKTGEHGLARVARPRMRLTGRLERQEMLKTLGRPRCPIVAREGVEDAAALSEMDEALRERRRTTEPDPRCAASHVLSGGADAQRTPEARAISKP
jgi:hypothetical protein